MTKVLLKNHSSYLAIKKLYDAGTSKIDISKILNITKQSLNDYFYFYNLDNRNNF